MCCLRRPNSRRKQGTTTFENCTISSTRASSAGIPLRPAKSSAIRRALVRSPHESGCTASSRILLVQRGQESGETCLPQVLNEGRRTVQQVLTLCKDSRLPLPVRCGGFSVYSVRDFRFRYQAYWSLFPGDLGGSGLCGHESCPSCGRHIIKDNRFVDFVDCAPMPDNTTVRRGRTTREAVTGDSERLADERNRCSQLPDRIWSHLSSSSRARISESWAASTGSRHKAERSAVLSQKEAAGSARTSSMLGRSPAVRAVAHPRLLTPLRSQLHRRSRSARRLTSRALGFSVWSGAISLGPSK